MIIGVVAGVNLHKTEHSLHKRVAYRLHERGWSKKSIGALFGVSDVTPITWLRHMQAMIGAPPMNKLRQAVGPVRQALYAFCARHDISPETIQSPNREAWLVAIRHQAFYEVQKATGASEADLARVFKRDRATVRHGLRRHAERVDNAP